jgi:hypothetical protein
MVLPRLGDEGVFSRLPRTTITVPWSAAAFVEVKGILHSPSPHRSIRLDTRDALLNAVAKARSWINDLLEGRIDPLGCARWNLSASLD